MSSSFSLHTLLARWRDFVAGTNYPQPPSYTGADVQFYRFIEDSRIVRPNDCFVARIRPYSNGHPFIGSAIEKGASLVIAQDGEPLPATTGDAVVWQVPDTAEVLTWLAAAAYNFPGKQMSIIGITGTDGKTSIANLLYDILVAAGHKTAMLSTIKAVIGNDEEATGLHVTTPQAPQVQALLRRMVDDGCTHCVLEVTSMGLAEQRADTAFFDVAVVSNIQHEHLDYHGSWEQYVADKARLFQLASQLGVCNRDDQSWQPVIEAATVPMLAYSLSDKTALYANDIVYSADATTFTLHLPSGQSTAVSTILVGEFNVYNMLAAAGAAWGLGVSAEQITRGLANVEVISGRMQRINAGQTFLTIVDFAHTPNALLKAIEATRSMIDGRVITVFGSAGRRDVHKRRLMAEVSAQEADLTILTAEDPRNEPLSDILDMMADGCRSHGAIEGETFWRIDDRGRAIHFALTLARPNDVVLICGKGHEQSMCFGSTEYPWDDREATRAALHALRTGNEMVNLGLPTY